MLRVLLAAINFHTVIFIMLSNVGSLLYFEFYAHDGLAPVAEAEMGGAIGGWEDVRFGTEGTELRGSSRVGSNWG